MTTIINIGELLGIVPEGVERKQGAEMSELGVLWSRAFPQQNRLPPTLALTNRRQQRNRLLTTLALTNGSQQSLPLMLILLSMLRAAC